MSAPPARVLHISLDLLDRQIRDRDGVLCGNVDDVEIERTDDGRLFVTHLVTGGGALAYRLGRRTFGSWLHRNAIERGDGETDRTTIPIVSARRIGPAIDVSVTAADLANHDGERWVADHVIDHVPLGGRRAGE
jgi:hypothetical protein